MNRKSAKRQLRRQSQFRLKPVYAAVLLAFAAQTAQANPAGGTVVNGSAAFATAGSTLTVTNTPGTIINWQSFSIGSNEITNFAQQSASSTVLNRVVGNDPSNILGKLQSNGRVFLLNPNGILFGAGAVVDVAGLVATTLNLSNADFLAGNYHFTAVPGAGDIGNAGNISAQDHGQIYLIAPNVENSGVITAPDGEILLAAGASVDLVSTDDPDLRVNITAPAGNATNVGQLIASSGSLGLFGTVVGNSGIVSADSATMEGGKIVFKASQTANAGGTISAQGIGGGTIDVLADKQSGTVNVSGTLDTSAPVSGNGGFIETSAAHVEVADTASVTTLAASGQNGTWLIDPTDFTISTGTGGLTTSGIGAVTLSTSLGTGNVTIQTSASGSGNGDIFVNGAVSWGTNTLTLSAARNININANLNANLVGAGPPAGLALQYGQGAVAAGNTANYFLAPGVQVNLLSGGSFSTKLGSNGSVTNYTIITSLGAEGSTTGTDLQGMNFNLAGDYVLGADIDASNTSNTGIWTSGLGFSPVGNTSGAFTGQFDGLGHTITGLYINRPTQNYVGLFGDVTGNIRNVGLVSANVTGSQDVGSLAGYNAGIIDNSYSSSSSITGSGTYAYYVGGLVGLNAQGGSISNSYANSGRVYENATATNYYAGGLAGYNSGTISNSSASGQVTGGYSVGGLVGYHGSVGTISNSYVSSGSVLANDTVVGGLVGNNLGQVSNSHYDIDAVTVQGSSSNITLGGLYNDNPTNGQNGQYDDWLNNGLKLNIANYASLSGSGNNYTITTAQGIKDLLGFSDKAAYTFTLGADIDLVNNAGLYIPYLAAHFNGNNHTISNLNVSQSFNDNLGLFGNIAAGGTVSGLILSNPSVSGNSTVGAMAGRNQGTISNSHIDNSAYGGSVYATNYDVGGLVGINDGTISGSYINNGNNGVGSVSGTSDVGGLVGTNHGSISNSYVDDTNAYGGTVTGSYDVGGLVGYNVANNTSGTSSGGNISNSYVSNGKVSGGSEVGGLVGYSRQGSISNSYVSGGTVTGFGGNFNGSRIGGLVGYSNTTISSSYATGVAVNGISDVGGLVGYNDGGEGGGNISGSYFSAGTVNGATDVGGLVGYGRGSTSYQGKVGGVVSNSYVSNGTIIASSSDAGGLVGYSNGTISNSYVSGGSVKGVTDVGGLVGYNDSKISGGHVSGAAVTASGNDAGGLVGYNNGTISGSYASGGNVTGVADVGGLVGYNAVANSSSGVVSGGVINTSYVSGGTISGTGNNVGGLVGTNAGDVSSSYVNASTVTGSSNVGGLVGLNGNTTTSVTATSTISGSYVSGGTVSANSSGGYAGGLAGYNSGKIAASYVSGGSVNGTCTDCGGGAGGLAGYNDGTIMTSYVSNGSVVGSDYEGGLVGRNNGSIVDTYASGASLSGGTYIGGLVGYNTGTINTSYASSGTLSGGTIGGVAGYNDPAYGGSVTASFWNTTSAAGVVYGVGYDTALPGGTNTGATGLTSTGMMTMSNFTAAGWSISTTGAGTTWYIQEGVTMPLLSVFGIAVNAPDVIGEIVNIVNQHEKPKPEDFLVAEDSSGNPQSLPMCN